MWQEATALVRAGYVVSIVCPRMAGQDAAYEEIDGVRIWRHPLPVEASGAWGYLAEYSLALFFEFVLAWRVFFGPGFDAIHGCNPPDTIFLVGGFFKLFLGKAFLFDHHDINPELFEAKFKRRGPLHRLMLALERWTFRTADVSIATNQSYRKIAIERGGMSADRVFVVRSGPDLGRMKISPPVEPLKNGCRYLVAYLGTMGKQEGIDYLLEAARHVACEMGRDDVFFRIVGGGSELEALRERSRSMGLCDRVAFMGRIPDAEMLEVLNTADVCVNPDEHNEMNDKSTMNKIMEYMSLAKPIVQFDLTEGRFTAQQASLYARPNDAVDLAERIVELLDDAERREQMGRLGRERVERELAWRYEEPKLLEAYAALFGES